jgi:chemotaxis protein CheD
MESSQAIAVGLGEVYASKEDGTVLVAYGLGSCVAVCAWDESIGACGMAHVMLPQSNGTTDDDSPGKYADKAIPLLIRHLAALGASTSRLKFKIAGGSQMLVAPGFKDRLDIGGRNVSSVTRLLSEQGYSLLAHDTGGNRGRTVQMLVKSGMVKVRTIGGPEREL